MKKEKKEKRNRRIRLAQNVRRTAAVLLFGLLCVVCSRVRTQAEEELAFDGQGNLRMTTHDRIATSGRSYKTIGWTIKRYDMPIGAAGNDSVTVILEDYGSTQPDPADPAYQYCYFWCSYEKIFERIGAVSPEWQQELYSSGGVLYLDAVMTTCRLGVPQGGLENNGDSAWGRVFYTYEGIAGADNWSDKQALRTHFNKRLHFAGNPALLKKELHYEIACYECFDDRQEFWSLSRYGKDRQGVLENGGELIIWPENFSSYHFVYESAHIIEQYEDGGSADSWTKSCPLRLQDDREGILTIRLELYYKRQNSISYLSDSFHMDGDSVLAEGTVKIGAGRREQQCFDTDSGVPSGEDLYVQGSLNALAYKVRYANHYGIKTRKVRIVSIYQGQWTEADGTQRNMQWYVPEIYYVDRPYSYWTIEEIEVYTLQGVTVQNYAFDGENVRIGEFYHPRLVVEQRREHMKEEPVEEYWIDRGILTGDGQMPVLPAGGMQAEASLYAGQFLVVNDSFAVDDEVFLGGNEVRALAGSPKLGSSSGRLEFYADRLTIPYYKRNGRDYESTARAEYVRYSSGTLVEKVLAVNPVTIHTPVVCHGYVTDEKMFNQLCKPDGTRKTWILGKEFRVKLSDYGTHLEQLGYGKQDYQKYAARHQLQFPFPVYYGPDYYEAGEWIDYEEDAKEQGEGMPFYLPTGVKEGNYTVRLRSLAYNYRAGEEAMVEPGANYHLENYGACEDVLIAVCGRLYGMRITDIKREGWHGIFWKPSELPTGHVYTIGLHNMNGTLVRRNPLASFPILAGGHPLCREQEGELLGTVFSYSLETIGDYGAEDGIYIEPEYYVTDQNGGNRQSVDIYCFAQEEEICRWENIKETKESGGQYLGMPGRSNIGSTERNVENKETAVQSVQRWKGSFSVPDDIYVVPAGTDVEEYVVKRGSIKETDPLFIRRGYLMVQFMVYSVKDGERYLNYINEDNAREGYANMWQIEGFQNPKLREDGTGFFLEYGDVFLYDLQKHIRDSHEIMGTH